MIGNLRHWTYKEIAIVISAIHDSMGIKVNINYLKKLLVGRTESAIRNKVHEFADKMQYFKLETTIMPLKGDSFENFRIRIFSPNRREYLIHSLFKYDIFDKRTSTSLIDNFWKFNNNEVIQCK